MLQRLLFRVLALCLLAGCSSPNAGNNAANTQLAALLDTYFEQSLQLSPVSATLVGDNRYNDQLPAEFTDSHRAKMKSLLQGTLDKLHAIDRNGLNEQDRISYDFLDTYATLQLRELDYPFNLIPTDQMWGQHLLLGQFASGGSAQPFKTVQDYDNWLRRIDAMEAWTDSAIVYFRKGISQGITLPRPLVQKLIPQFEALAVSDPKQHLYYGPVKTLPESFSAEEKVRLTAAYTAAITGKVVPMNSRMAAFLKNEYLPKARTTSGYGAMPQGDAYYKLRVEMATTTSKTPEEIYNIGLQEVARIRGEMEALKHSVGYKGSLKEFFQHLNTDPAFKPFKTPEAVLAAFRQIHDKIKPRLKEQFGTEPKTPFEIRQTEAFRAASASAEYNASPDNIKPGVFYIPILDATQFTVHSGMESLFLHEAIPGHHYQISLQRENKALPKLRQYDPFSNAYVEGWALYCESLGKDLGLYTDPYQRMGALGDEMHRAIRLVVDVGLHTKGMSREEAIRYMMDNEPISEQGATAEIERYMSGPGQALGYKIGQLKIRELRTKYAQQLGSRFRVADFHTEVLKDGSMPLSTLEAKLDRWAAEVK